MASEWYIVECPYCHRDVDVQSTVRAHLPKVMPREPHDAEAEMICTPCGRSFRIVIEVRIFLTTETK